MYRTENMYVAGGIDIDAEGTADKLNARARAVGADAPYVSYGVAYSLDYGTPQVWQAHEVPAVCPYMGLDDLD